MASLRDTLANLVEQYKQSDTPLANLMRGDTEGAKQSVANALQQATQDPYSGLNVLGTTKIVSKTAQELAHELASKNAENMLGLPAGNTAMERAKALGFNVDEPVYHGTTHEFTKFGGKLHNPEGHLGAGHYFTTSPADASINYANLESPDLTQRIAKRTEDILSEHDIYDWTTGDKNYNKAFQQAKNQIAGQNEGTIIPAFLRSKNTLDISPESKNWIDFTPKYNKQDEYIPSKLYKALQKQSKIYGFSADDAINSMDLYDEVNAHNLDKALRDNEAIMYAEHPKTGAFSSSEIIRNLYKDLGYDAVKMNANSAFPKMFEQIPEDVSHIIVNNPNQIRSPFAAFDPARVNEPDLLAGAMALPIATDKDKRNKLIDLLKQQ